MALVSHCCFLFLSKQKFFDHLSQKGVEAIAEVLPQTQLNTLNLGLGGYHTSNGLSKLAQALVYTNISQIALLGGSINATQMMGFAQWLNQTKINAIQFLRNNIDDEAFSKSEEVSADFSLSLEEVSGVCVLFSVTCS